ncbi:MAG: class I SAM-dependent methyltransferase [Actinomycetota bacterium]|nr:class I SAM-dependent methyltransferase [Actinomycetota bacterium]
MTAELREIQADVEQVPAWYHSIELAPGVVSPGYFDLRPIVGDLPWPDVRGKRCLDVGTYDGFYAFELERRGAAEVIAVDVADPRDWDWPPDAREEGPARAERFTLGERTRGFEVARRALGSAVERRDLSIYELSPETLGSFDVVVCGSLLLHLRDPLRGLEAIRTVCRGSFLSVEEVRLSLSPPFGRRPVAELDGSGEQLQWWVPSVSGHRRMLVSAGFATGPTAGPFAVRYGPSHPTAVASPNGWRWRRTRLLQRALAGAAGVPHAAVLAKPRP